MGVNNYPELLLYSDPTIWSQVPCPSIMPRSRQQIFLDWIKSL